MIPFGMAVTIAGYAVGSWGWVLVKGWNIPARSWFSPLNPWQWPAGGGKVPMVPQGHLFPTSQAIPTKTATTSNLA